MASVINSLNNLANILNTSSGNTSKASEVKLSGENGLFNDLPGYNGNSIEEGALNILESIKIDYSLRENLDEWLFRHYLEDLGISYPQGYLSSVNSTPSDNEDPVSFGYDIIINYANSPLFNGAIEDFCNKFSSVKEINSRLGIIYEFKQQFFKFFKIDSPKLSANDAPPPFYNINGRSPQRARTYYIKKIAGLDRLSESINSDSPIQFVNYGKDYLTLTLNEDVTVNMGYLASLYRMLSWSRLNGKNMFPENLLRFDMAIVVTEARKFNRVDSGVEYADVISRYIYQVYECQMFFEKLSHEDTIDMTKLEASDGFDLRINYKYATLQFDWLKNYDFANKLVSTDYNSPLAILNNSLSDLTTIPPNFTNIFALFNSTLQTTTNQEDLNEIPTSGSPDRTIYGIYHSDSGWRDSSRTTSQDWQDDKNTIRYQLLEKTLTNIKTNLSKNTGTVLSGFTEDGWSYNIPAYNQNLNQNSFLGSLLGGVIRSVLSGVNSGFTEDGWQYNLAAYYVNRTFNRLNNTLANALGVGGVNVSSAMPGINIPAFTYAGLQLDSEDWLATHTQVRNSQIAPKLTLGPEGWKINTI
jgi:hypothetical protein